MERGIPVAVLLEGVAEDDSALAHACALAGRDATNLTVLTVAPRFFDWALWLAWVDPDLIRREAEEEDRTQVRDALGELGMESGHRLEVLPPRCSNRELERILDQCAAVVVPAGRSRLARRVRRIAERVAVDSVVPSPALASEPDQV
jgi:hypothetical protein